jgi:hypothetical protein
MQDQLEVMKGKISTSFQDCKNGKKSDGAVFNNFMEEEARMQK